MKHHGFSLIELMIATVIGAFLIAGAFSLYTQLREQEHFAHIRLQMDERAQFALDSIATDLQLANFWGQHNRPDEIENRFNGSIHCGKTRITGWVLDVTKPVELGNDRYALPCTPRGIAAAGTDTLTVRYANTDQTKSSIGTIRVFSDYLKSYLHSQTPAAEPDTHDSPVVVRSYYIEESTANGWPELRRFALAARGRVRNELVIENIRSLQVRFLDPELLNWIDNAPAGTTVALIELEAVGEYRGQPVTKTYSRIAHLKNMSAPAGDAAGETPGTE